MPVALLLRRGDATVTICHSKTANLPEIIGTADILVAATGHPNFVQSSWLKPGVVVIDVGTTPSRTTKKAGVRWVGDVDFEGVKGVARAITPVPGGVGPMSRDAHGERGHERV
ncbi:tetrahydrofolate dehydrogenase/cyclohydrolase [Cladochytrium replicatum]|nr:tetrahydrofolate dehydrogenase/cyclohydrolase [Cladochytrium replicatum]